VTRPALSRTATAVRSSIFAELAPRIEAHARAVGDLVELHIGDTHVAPPELARFARCGEGDGELDAALYRYGAIAGVDALKDAIAARLTRLGHGPQEIDPRRHVLLGCGATHAAFCVLRAVLDAGDEVIVMSPYWPLAVGIVRAAGAEPVEVPLTTRLHEEPALDVAAAIDAKVTPRTRAIYLITPNNPDGQVLTTQQLAAVARVAEAHDLWVLSDEVYADYVYEGEHASIARLAGMAERTLSIYSLSKSHALAGARVGYAVAPERVVEVARRIATHTVFNVPVASQRVALAAIMAREGWIEDTRRQYRAARDAALESLAGTGARTFAPGGGSYLFVDFAPVLAGRPLRELLERAIDRGVLLAPGDGFGEGYATWARLCFTSVPPERLRIGLERLRAAITERV
jgi:aspartate/methionine/tyrosine aminotransferase